PPRRLRLRRGQGPDARAGHVRLARHRPLLAHRHDGVPHRPGRQDHLLRRLLPGHSRAAGHPGLTMIDAEHEYLHPPGEDPYWNESSVFMFQAPERNLSGFVSFYHRPNMRYSVGGVGLWNGSGDGHGEHIYDCLYHDWAKQVPFPDGGQMYDFTLENGLTVSCKEPLKSFRLAYHAEGCDLELDWDAILPAHAAGLPGKGAVWGAGRYEQAGRAVGTVRVDDGEFEIDWW